MGNFFSNKLKREQILYINASDIQKSTITYNVHKIISNYISENTIAPIKINLIYIDYNSKEMYVLYTFNNTDIYLPIETWKNILAQVTDKVYTCDYIHKENTFIRIKEQSYITPGYLLIKFYKKKRTLKYEIKYTDKDVDCKGTNEGYEGDDDV